MHFPRTKKCCCCLPLGEGATILLISMMVSILGSVTAIFIDKKATTHTEVEVKLEEGNRTEIHKVNVSPVNNNLFYLIILLLLSISAWIGILHYCFTNRIFLLVPTAALVILACSLIVMMIKSIRDYFYLVEYRDKYLTPHKAKSEQFYNLTVRIYFEIWGSLIGVVLKALSAKMFFSYYLDYEDSWPATKRRPRPKQTSEITEEIIRPTPTTSSTSIKQISRKIKEINYN